MSRRRNSGQKAARRRRAREVSNESPVLEAVVALSRTTFLSTSRATYEGYLVTRSAVTQTLDDFYGTPLFRKTSILAVYATTTT